MISANIKNLTNFFFKIMFYEWHIVISQINFLKKSSLSIIKVLPDCFFHKKLGFLTRKLSIF